MNIVITDHINLSPEGKKKLQEIPNLKIYDDVVNEPKIILTRIREAEIVTANFIDLTADIINQSPKLKYIIVPAKGYDWIDVKTAKAKGIKILNCPSYNSQAVAEHAIALLFSLLRRLIPAHNSILNGEFNQQKYIGLEVGGKLLTTIGYGNIGKRIIKIAEGIGMRTDYVNSKSTPEEVDEKIRKTDFLVLCLPLNDMTKNFMDKKRLRLLKKDAVIINVARGLVTDQGALFEALKEKRIAAAGIDTFAKDETINAATQEIIDFAKLDNVVATPHIAYNTKEASERLGDELIANIQSCLKNNPINVVNA